MLKQPRPAGAACSRSECGNPYYLRHLTNNFFLQAFAGTIVKMCVFAATAPQCIGILTPFQLLRDAGLAM